MKFLVPNYSCLQNPRRGGYRPQIPVLSVLCPQLNLLNPTPRKKFLGTPLDWVTFHFHSYACFVIESHLVGRFLWLLGSCGYDKAWYDSGFHVFRHNIMFDVHIDILEEHCVSVFRVCPCASKTSASTYNFMWCQNLDDYNGDILWQPTHQYTYQFRCVNVIRHDPVITNMWK